MRHQFIRTSLAPLLLLVATCAAFAEGKSIRVTAQELGDLDKRLAADPNICEVVIAAGVYHSGVSVSALKGVDAAQHPLLLRAEDGAEVMFDGSDREAALEKAAPVENHPGVYGIAYTVIGRESPKLWEPAARARYQQVADVRSVAKYPGTYALEEKRLVFHTSDGQAPAPGQVLINHAYLDYGLFITRPNVTVRGIKFRNYVVRDKWSTAVQLRGDKITVEDCAASNCSLGFTIIGNNCILRNCRADDCGGGVYVGGNDALVENCRMFKRRDAFMMTVYEQDDSGIQYYHPATNGVLRGNIAQGFARGITLKCEGVFLVEHNTILDCHEGILRTVPQVGDRYERNLIVGCDLPGLGGRLLRPGVSNDWNVFWDARNSEEMLAVLEGARMIGTGGNNIVADPRFVNREGGDFRLSPGSICAIVSGTNRPVGAFAAATDAADKAPPVVRLQLRMPAFPSGAVGRVVFERDPWIGGGTTFVEELHQSDPNADYDTGEREVNMEIEARDSAGKPQTISLRINDESWSNPEPYARRKKIQLPDKTGIYVLAVRVADEAGNMSEPALARIRLTRDAVTLDGEPTVYANDHGVVLSFRSSAPAFARVEYSSDLSYGQSQEQPQRVHRRWNSNDGGDWVSRWREPTTEHFIPLIEPVVKKGATYHYRIVLEDAVGRQTRGQDRTFTVAGPARTVTVTPASANEPFQTIQFAVDRALPGDRIVIQPGVYPGDTLLTHGGVEGAPITIEAATPNSVVLDSARSTYCLLRLDKAPYVVIRNLQLRSYKQQGAAIYLADSDHVTIEGCKIWNGLHGEGWPFGHGIFAHRSPGLTARNNVLFNQEHGIFLLVSPQATVVNNTTFKNLYTGLSLHFSCAGSKVLNNSFAYNQTEQILISDPDQAAFTSMVCDYNNLATRILPVDAKEVTSTATPEDPSLNRGDESKAIVNVQDVRYRDFGTWRKAHGKDAHSIFVDPRYVAASSADLRLKPGSPNLKAGKDGATIGALGAAN